MKSKYNLLKANNPDFKEFERKFKKTYNYTAALGGTQSAIDLCLAYAFEAGANHVRKKLKVVYGISVESDITV